MLLSIPYNSNIINCVNTSLGRDKHVHTFLLGALSSASSPTADNIRRCWVGSSSSSSHVAIQEHFHAHTRKQHINPRLSVASRILLVDHLYLSIDKMCVPECVRPNNACARSYHILERFVRRCRRPPPTSTIIQYWLVEMATSSILVSQFDTTPTEIVLHTKHCVVCVEGLCAHTHTEKYRTCVSPKSKGSLV